MLNLKLPTSQINTHHVFYTVLSLKAEARERGAAFVKYL